MLSKKNKWKYAKFSRTLISYRKIQKLQNKKNVVVYDTRVKDSYNKGHIEDSIHVSALKIKKAITEHKKNTKIILVGNEERSNAHVASWARFNGYKHIKLLKVGMNKLSKKHTFVKEVEKK
ncbi:rhodanese-like domain-containing protein [Mycoplasma todarodis]|uniref:rhodanese-like domain-containing protein n=1 Tax=Mycoplasma todarodis TaxID=1937191 RepID=UPI003B5103EC